MSQNVYEFTVPMALEDYLPIAFSAFGLFMVAKTIRQKHPNAAMLAGLGAVLIVTDGLLKATWKLIYATSGQDIAWMHDSLFVLMGPGFMMFSWALWRGLKNTPSTFLQVWAIPMVIVAFAMAIAGYLAMTQPNRSWARVLLMLTTFGTVWMSGQLIRSSWKRGLYLAIFLFVYNIITIFLQAWLAQMPQTTALQWTGQINNTLSWAAFAIGAWLWQRYPKPEVEES